MAAPVVPIVVALVAAFVAAKLVSRPANPGALLWWLGIGAVGITAGRLVYGLMIRVRTFAALLGIATTFPSRAPSRVAIACVMPDTRRLRRALDELSKGAWTVEVQSRRAALVTALWAVEESTQRRGMLWRDRDGNAGVRLTEGEIPGLLQVLPRPLTRDRSITTGACLAALALLLASVALAGPRSAETHDLADRGGGTDLSGSPWLAPVGELPAAVDAEPAVPVANPRPSSPQPSVEPLVQPSVEPALPAGRATIQDPSATLVVQRGSGAAPAVSGELAATAVSSFASVDELAQPGVLQFPAASTTAPATHEAARVSEDAGASEDSGVATAPSARALSPPALVAPALVASPVTDPHAAPGSAARSPDVAIDAGAAATAGRAMVDHPAFDRDEPPRTIVGSPHPPGDTSSTVPSAAGPG